MDPIRDGNKIFSLIHQEIGKDLITDIDEFGKFLEILLDKTKGWVIVDFLDAGNWDRIETYEIDKENGLVNINWHDYRNVVEDENDKFLRSGLFPADVYGLMLQFQELRLIKIGNTSLFLFKGYALSLKEVDKIMNKETTQFEITNDGDNFSVKVIRQINKQWQCYDFLNTPIFSTIILPKNARISAADSKKILFYYNLYSCNERITKVSFDVINGNEDSDFLCEKANTLRRIMESVLKIECCYRHKQIQVKKSYSELLLGDLISLVKKFRSDEEKVDLNSIVRLANELSHDSGKPVTKEKTLMLSGLVDKYCEALNLEIRSNPNPHFGFG